MCDLLIFGGTTEGRIIADYCEAAGIKAYLSVVSDYGEEILPDYSCVSVIKGAMDEAQIRDFISAKNIAHVIDATHPFAKSASANIRRASGIQGVTYLRCLRDAERRRELSGNDVITVESLEDAVRWLCEHATGNILAVTGSKELDRYQAVPDYSDRVYVRILPNPEMIEKCIQLGFSPSHICGMQGPFSEEFNIAHIKAVHADYMVTKESGRAGGFDEKLSACRKAGITCIIIRKPEEEGKALEEVCDFLKREYSAGISLSEVICQSDVNAESLDTPKVSLVGIGPGSQDYFTSQALTAIREADIIIGAGRMTDSARGISSSGAKIIKTYKADEMLNEIQENPDKKIAVLYSGDTGFYSGAKGLGALLSENMLPYTVIPGISSFQYFASKLKVPYQNSELISCHGIEADIDQMIEKLQEKDSLFILVGGNDGVNRILKDLTAKGLGSYTVCVGENLSYPEEKITIGTAEKLADGAFVSLSVVYITKNEK